MFGLRKSKARFEVYNAEDGDWYWRLISNNGRIIADGSEGYETRQSCTAGVKRVKKYSSRAKIVVERIIW